MTERLKRVGSVINLCLTLVPAVLLVLFTLEALWMRLSLGHWPVVYRDVAVGSIAVGLEWLTSVGLMAVFYGVPFWALSLVAAWAAVGQRRILLRVSTYLGAIAMLVVVHLVNPFGFPEWWLD